jgi:response regulator of citrate/malate metabolism
VGAVTEMPIVTVRTALRPSTWRALEHHAKSKHCTVGELLSVLADDAVAPAPTPGRTYVRVTAEHLAEIYRLADAGNTLGEIARAVGISKTSVSNYLTRREAP